VVCAGGGARGFCDYEEIKDALKECEGLEGERLEACYAAFGCDIEKVTEHYTKAAGLDKDGKEIKELKNKLETLETENAAGEGSGNAAKARAAWEASKK